MGWTAIDQSIPSKEVNNFLRKEFGEGIQRIENGDGCKFVSYKNEEGKIYANVVLWSNKGGFHWKVMSEFMGPYYYGCSKSFLNSLSPLDQFPEELTENAQAWRDKNRELADKKEKIAKAFTIKVVDSEKIYSGYSFTEVHRTAKKNRWRTNTGIIVQLTTKHILDYSEHFIL
jgi:hypothetical protein